MTWTVKIKDPVKHNATFDVTVEFYKDGTYFDEKEFPNISDPTTLKQLIGPAIKQYKMIDELDASKLVGDFDPTPDKAEEPTPTQAELDAAQFQKDLFLLQKLDRAVALKVITSTNSAYTAQLTKVKNAVTATPAYIKYF